MYQTLIGKANTMRIHANLSLFLWKELYLIAAHLHNQTLTQASNKKTPYELWHEQQPNYLYIWKIGCCAYVLVFNRHNPKIYEWFEECVLIGYATRSKAYKCYHWVSHWIITTAYVSFIEHQQTIPFLPWPTTLPISNTTVTTMAPPTNTSLQTSTLFDKDDLNIYNMQRPQPNYINLPLAL